MEESFAIEDLDTLRAIADTTRLAILECLFEPRTVTELAAELDLPRTRLYHHVNLLVDKGLVRVVETRPVGAIPERVYQVVAKSFRPDRRLLQGADNQDAAEAVLTAILDTTRADLARVLRSGIVALEEGRARRRLGLGRWLLVLDEQRATELLDRMNALLAEYEEDEEGVGTEPYALTWAFYPSPRRLL